MVYLKKKYFEKTNELGELSSFMILESFKIRYIYLFEQNLKMSNICSIFSSCRHFENFIQMRQKIYNFGVEIIQKYLPYWSTRW
jgi:hypothetical protein